MDATENVDVALGGQHEEKKETRKSRKRKMKEARSAEESLETDGEKLAGEMKDSGILDTTRTEIGDAVQESELVLKSFPVGVDDKIASDDKGIDPDTTGDVVASGNVHEENKGKKRKKRIKRQKTVSVAAVSENILETEGDSMGSQAQNNGIEQTTGNKVMEGTEMHDHNGAQEGALRKSSPLKGDGNSILEDTVDLGVTENGVALSNRQVKRNRRRQKMLKKKTLSVAVNPEKNLETEGDKLASQTHNNGLDQTTGNQTLEGTEIRDGAQEGCLMPTTPSVGADVNIMSKDKTIDPDVTENVAAVGNLPEEKKDKKDACKKKGVEKKRKLSSVSQSDFNDEDREKDRNVESSSVNDGESKHYREGNNVASGEGIPLTASILEVAVLDVEKSDACQKKWTKRKRNSASVSQLDLNDEDGEKDGNMKSCFVNDGESNNSREGNNVARGEGIPSIASVSSFDSIKDVCGPFSSGEAIHEKILLPSPERQCVRPPSRKLLILDINGLLADIVAPVPFGYKPDLMLSGKAVFKRPFCESFLKFCFEKFDVGVWSSRVKINVDKVLNFLMGEMKNKLVFYWDRSHCTITGFSTIENRDKPLVLKELRKLWDDHQFHLGKYDQTNTLLLDDSPYKALCNPADTAIFPLSYHYKDVNDCSLGPGGDLRVYLERLAMADSIPEFVRNNRFGQRPIRDTNMSWNYYKKVIDSRESQGKC